MAARRAGILALVIAVLAAGPPARASGPTLTASPAVAGTAAAGNRLEAETGTWASATTVTYAYQWYRCDASGAHCLSIHGATAPGYELGTKDVGQSIGLTVTATDSSGTKVAYASLVGPIANSKPLLVATAQPQVTGLPIAGKPLQVTAGAWSPAPTTITYAWQRCNANGRLCVPISGATASSYTVTDTDVGHSIVALVQAKFGTTTQPALSTATAASVGNDLTGPTHEANPSVAGIAEQGSQLTASAGIWTGIGSISYAYQWYRCDDSGAHCSSIRGATKSTYRTVAKDAGGTLAFTVRATDSTGTAAAYAPILGPIAPAHAALASTAQPALTGSAAPGSSLSVTGGVWLPAATTFGYIWKRCNQNGRLCVPIDGATGSSYQVAAADVGHELVAVVSTTAGTTTQSAYSSSSPPVA